ncbi:serine hydrolase [Streptomyces sp. V1I1]|uniref:serine hydrolase n=1 Tax=Streptomyces sp. V1I1 TaxID=3042272 RepID=UPI0027878FA6|nr:serine hydrolase [Streptomyces sp. V1I1]MDQ0942751.1 D-alanyl-D-alanine carboxypeptidase (penicillin-binding protein 5/6) [Streptomyces sp. V1I1]
MTHEGGTVAGESPDKSEQRKSSGETTPGERDPRLAVFRQASPGATAPAVDQPTAVFKLPSSERSGGPGADQDAAPGSRSVAEPGTESGSVENDTRLRAVAAWVASADGDADADASGDADSDAGASGDAGSGDPDAREDAPAGAEEADAGEQTDPQAEAADGDAPVAVDTSGDDSADAEASAAQQDGDGREDAPAGLGDVEAGEDPQAEAADGDAPVAVDASGDDSADADGREDAPAGADDADEDVPVVEDASGDDGGSEDASDAVERDAPAGADDADAGEQAESQADDADADAPVAVDASGDAREAVPAATPTGETGADTEDAPGDGAADSAESGDVEDDVAPSAKYKAGASEETDGDAGVDAEEGPGDRPPTPTADEPSADEPKDKTSGSPESAAAKGEAAKPDASPDAEAKAAPTAPGSAEAKPSKPAVDQPTAVFKALRRPAVDQPTTALKVPPAPRPEAPAERTSTFVPLRAEAVRTPAPAPAKPKESAPPVSLTEAERTKQQPMPPLPPLDLLAELTNTPPPPQTPVRTVVRRIKIWTPLVVLLLIIFAIAQAFRPLPAAELALSTEPTFTFKGGRFALPWPGEGQGAVEVEGVGSLGTYGAQKPAPIASIAKTMTAYVILKDHPIKGKEVGPKITVDQQAEDESKLGDESTAQISKGQQFTERQMLQLLMIPSGNNAARLLARWDAKSEAEFVKKMNDAAKELGMTNSTYTDPSGLKATTVSTPQDQLKLAKAVMQNDVFREIVNTTITTIPGIDGQIRNNNDRALLKEGVGGIKTGSSTPAGGNLLWSANAVVDGKVRRIVGITMGVQNAAILNDKLELAITHSIKVIEAAQDGVTSATVIKKGDVVGYVDDGLGGRTPVVATKELKAVGWAGLKVEIELADGGRTVPHSAKAGTVVGQLSVGTGTGRVSSPVALQQDLAEPGLGDKLTRIG